MDIVKELAKVSIFKELNAAELSKLAEIGEVRDIGPGTDLLTEGNEVRDIWVLLMGTAKVLKRAEGGREEEIARLGSGSYLGELELSRHERKSAATVQAVESTHAVAFAHSKLLALCESDLTFGYHFFKGVAGGLARRLAVTDDDTARYRSIALNH